MTDERDTPASPSAGKRRAPRKRPESEVDREALAKIVGDRLAELRREGVTQEKVAQRAGCSPSTIRNMKNKTGRSHFEHDTLTRVAIALGLPADRLVKAYFRPVPQDPAPLSDAEVTVQLIMNQLEPYLASISALSGMQTDISDMKKDVEGMRQGLQGVVHDIHHVKSQVDILLDIDHPTSDGEG